MEVLGLVAVGVLAMVLWGVRVGQPAASAGDVQEYLEPGRAPRPFCWRWGVRAIVGRKPPTETPFVALRQAQRWIAVSRLGLVLSPLAVWAYGRAVWGASSVEAAVLVWLWVWLAPVWERVTRVGMLTEGVGFALGMGAAAAFASGWWVVGAVLAVAWGTLRETAGAWVAIWGATPWGLVGVLGVPWWRRGGRPWRNAHLFDRPWRRFAAMRWEWGLWRRAYWCAWGPAVVGVLGGEAWVLGAIAFAAWPLLRSVDTARLLVYAWPVVAGAAVAGADTRVLVGMVLAAPVMSSIWEA